MLGLTCVAGTLLIGASATLVERGNRWLDGVLFHRANYRTELHALTAAMAKAPDISALTMTVTTQLAMALRAEFVRFSAEHEGPSRIAVGVGTANHPRGYPDPGTPRARPAVRQ
jgi:hypothetical protein